MNLQTHIWVLWKHKLSSIETLSTQSDALMPFGKASPWHMCNTPQRYISKATNCEKVS